jgi:hypothetical protein
MIRFDLRAVANPERFLDLTCFLPGIFNALANPMPESSEDMGKTGHFADGWHPPSGVHQLDHSNCPFAY